MCLLQSVVYMYMTNRWQGCCHYALHMSALLAAVLDTEVLVKYFIVAVLVFTYLPEQWPAVYPCL